MKRVKYTVVSLFSGGMGLDIGIEQTGRYRVVACVEKEPAFCETIRENKRAGRFHDDLQVYCRPIETRALSLKEYARIQEFPDNWRFCGTIAERYAQVGNAVPIRLARLAGDVVAEQLDRLRDRNWAPDTAAPAVYRIRYIQSHVRTRVWYKDGQTIVWSDGQPNKHASYQAPKTRRKDTDLAKGNRR